MVPSVGGSGAPECTESPAPPANTRRTSKTPPRVPQKDSPNNAAGLSAAAFAPTVAMAA